MVVLIVPFSSYIFYFNCCFTNSCKINKAIKIVFSSGDRYISSSGNEEKETILDGKFICFGTYCHKYSYI